MIFKNKNGRMMEFDDKDLASLLGYTEFVDVEKFNSNKLKTGVFNLKTGKEADEHELETIETTLKSAIEDPHMSNPEMLRKIVDTYGFVIECNYRGGEQYKTILATSWDDPLEKVVDEMQWSDMWECEPLNSLWYLLKEAMDLLNLQ